MFRHKINYSLSLFDQKHRMKCNQSLLSQQQINYVMHLKKSRNAIGADTQFIKKSLAIPFNLLFYCNKVYVLSDIQLGKGGCGIVWAAEEFSTAKQSRWVAIKEGLNKVDYFDMAKILRDHPEEFWDHYEEILETLYCIQYKINDTSISKKILMAYANDLLKNISNSTYKLAKIHSMAIFEIYGNSVDIFSVGYFVYTVSPLIKGIDFSKLVDPRIFSTIQKSILQAKNIEKSRLQWNYFLLNYVKYLGDIILAIHKLHIKGFLHRDIKPSNIMLNTHGKIKLIDFDACVKMKNEVYEGDCEYFGTLAYQSPNFLTFEKKHSSIKNKQYLFTRSEDIYSLGISLKELGVEKLLACLFILYPQLKNNYSNLLKSMINLSDHDKHLRLYAMDYLVLHYPELIDAMTYISEITYDTNRSLKSAP